MLQNSTPRRAYHGHKFNHSTAIVQVIDAERGVAENIAEFTFFGREGKV